MQKKWLFKKTFFIILNLVYVCACVGICAYDSRCAQESEVLELLRLEWQATRRPAIWVLGMEFESSGRIVHAFNHLSISPTQQLCFRGPQNIPSVVFDLQVSKIFLMIYRYFTCKIFQKQSKNRKYFVDCRMANGLRPMFPLTVFGTRSKDNEN